MTVSGGHTQLVIVNSPLDFVEIGTTLDDAAGEAFDKSGKIMNLDCPAGPKIDKLALKGDINKFKFPKPDVKGLNFSFSGLKTNFKNFISNQPHDFVEKNINDLCTSLQQSTIVEILIDKIVKARDQFQINEFVICGGVSTNSYLRKELKGLMLNEKIKTYVPKINYSTDNAAMIGINGYFKFIESKFGELSDYSISKYNTMNIFYSNNINKSNKKIIILDQENSHLIKVLRKKTGDNVNITDGKDSYTVAQLLNQDKNKSILEIENHWNSKMIHQNLRLQSH